MGYRLLMLAMLIIILASCDDIFEEDIEDETVILLAPSDELATTVLTHTFWWDEIEGADEYNIQIATPSFSEIKRLMVDSNVTVTKFIATLGPGDYEWRVMAFNSGYETVYTTYSLLLDSTLILNEIVVELQSPGDSMITNVNEITFMWREVDNADYYDIEFRYADDGVWEGAGLYYFDKTENTSITVSDIGEGAFFWGIRATNDMSSTWYYYSYILVDTTLPTTPVHSSPAEGAEINDSSLVFRWSNSSDEGSSIKYKLRIYNNNGSLDKSIETYNNEYQHEFYSDDTYQWTIEAIDGAGNSSGESSQRSVVIDNSGTKSGYLRNEE